MKYHSVKLTPCLVIDVSKLKQREELQSEVDQFLAQGGKVKKLKGTQFVPRPARKEPKNKGAYALKTQVKKIRDWANAADYLAGRRAQLSEVIGINIRRVRSLLSPPTAHGAKMTQSEFSLFQDAIPFIERQESREKAA
jgi:hypothetical protein